MKLANNDKLVFSSLSDMLAQQAETIQEWYQSVPGYFLIAMTTATAFLIFAVIILGWKLYKTMLVVAVLSRQYGNANAQGESEYVNNARQNQPLVFARSTIPTTTQQSVQDLIMSAIQWRDMVLYIIGGIVAILAL